jgi:hypothetical protein
MNFRDWLTRLYPRAWRERYGEEFEALLTECLHSPLDLLDILLGAVDAHLELTHETNWRKINMNNKLRTAILIVFAAYIMFVVAGMGLFAFADDSPLVPLMQTDGALSAAWIAIEAGSVISLVAIVVGGAPLAWTIIHRAFTSRRKDLRLLLVPLYSVACFGVYTAVLIFLAFNTRSVAVPVPPIVRTLMAGEIIVFILAAIASTGAVWVVVSRSDVDQDIIPILGKPTPIRLYEFAFKPAVVATLAMLVMFVATIIWGWLVFSSRPDLFAGNLGPMMTSTRGSYTAILLLMSLASIAACFGLLRNHSSQ